MSRSFHQRHKTFRNRKNPRTILCAYIDKNGKRKIIWRNRKIKPYGLKMFIGYGEETYSKQFGEYFMPQINKKKERSNSSKKVKIESLEVMDEMERNKMVIDSLAPNDKLYIVSANGFDFDVFEITVIGNIDCTNNTFTGIEYGNPYGRERTYNVDELYTREEVKYYFHLNLYE